MTTCIASRLVPIANLRGQWRGWRRDLLAAYDDAGRLVASYPRGTELDVALASARHHDTGALEDLIEVLRLEARDGNIEAAGVVAEYERDIKGRA